MDVVTKMVPLNVKTILDLLYILTRLMTQSLKLERKSRWSKKKLLMFASVQPWLSQASMPSLENRAGLMPAHARRWGWKSLPPASSMEPRQALTKDPKRNWLLTALDRLSIAQKSKGATAWSSRNPTSLEKGLKWYSPLDVAKNLRPSDS